MNYSNFQKAKCKNHASGRSDELVNSFDVNHMNVFCFYLKYHDYTLTVKIVALKDL